MVTDPAIVTSFTLITSTALNDIGDSRMSSHENHDRKYIFFQRRFLGSVVQSGVYEGIM